MGDQMEDEYLVKVVERISEALDYKWGWPDDALDILNEIYKKGKEDAEIR